MMRKLYNYHYKASGLDYIYVDGFTLGPNFEGEESIAMPGFNKLYRLIAEVIVSLESRMDGKELCLLRMEMDMTQEELAELVHKDKQTIGRWERGETLMDAMSDAFIRLLAIERLKLNVKLSMEELAKRCGNPAKERKPVHLIYDEAKKQYYTRKAAPSELPAAA